MVTTTIREHEGYEWLELGGQRFPPEGEESPPADRARSLGPLTPAQCANLLCIPVPNRQTPDGVTVGAILDVLSRASAGERVRFTHGGRERTMASARTLQRWAEDLGVDAGLITVDVPGEVESVGITVGFVPPSACIMPPGWLDASSGAWLDVAAEQFYNIKRDPGETCDALRARLRAEQRKRDAATVDENRDRGTEPWLRRRLGALLGVEPSALGIVLVEPGLVRVTAWHCGVTIQALTAALARLEEELPMGVRLEVAPVRVINPVPLVAPKQVRGVVEMAKAWSSPLGALRAEIDRLIAADHGPFAHARAAALRSLAECPEDARRPMAPSAALSLLRTYEEQRGGAATPAPSVRRMADTMPMIAVYERERARSDVYARPAR